MSAMPVCTVCKRHKDYYDEKDEQRRAAAGEAATAKDNQGDGDLFIVPERGSKPDWAYTTERLAVSQVQAIFKLYEVLKREFLVGYICSECLSLLEQVDSLQFQLHAVTKALKDRVDSHCRSKVKKKSDVLDAREGYRAKYKELRSKKRAIIDLENEDAAKRKIADEDLPIYDDSFRSAEPQSSAANINPVETMKLNDDVKSNECLDYLDEKNLGNDHEEQIRSIECNLMGSNPEPGTSNSAEKQPTFYLNMSFWSNVNDMSYLHKILEKKNFDGDFSIFIASRGNECLLYDGNLWKKDTYFNTKKASKVINAWYCSKKYLKGNTGRSDMRQGTGCRARMATLADDSKIVLDSLEIDHNHDSNHEEVRHESFVCKLKEMISNDPSMDPPQIVATAELLYGKTYSTSFKVMVNFVANIQKKLGISKRPGNESLSHETKNFYENVRKKPKYQGELEKAPPSFQMAYDNDVSNGRPPLP